MSSSDRLARVRACCIVAIATLITIATAARAQTCPSPDPGQNYDCPVGPAYLLPAWGNLPWSKPQFYSTITVGDLDGDGRAEILIRRPDGLQMYSYDATLGTFMPVVAAGTANPLVLPLSDANGWSDPSYASTLAIVDLGAGTGPALVARGGNGLAAWKFARGPALNGLPTGTWSALTTSGPFPDNGCFADGKCWNSAPFYQMIRYGNPDGLPGITVAAWGGNGAEVWKWNGSGWTAQAVAPFLDPTGLQPPFPYFRFADIDGDGRDELVNWNPGGAFALKFSPGANGGSWALLTSGQGPYAEPGCAASCLASLQTARIRATGPVTVFAAYCGGSAGFTWLNGSWQADWVDGPFDACADFANAASYETVQAADIDGDGIDELVGRGPGGIVAWKWNASARSWNRIVANAPQLADAVWALDPSYWRTIRTAIVDGSPRKALIARGQNGVRTWIYDGTTFSRPKPFGSFPPFASVDESNAYTAINSFLGLPNGVRALYTDPSVDTKSSDLDGFLQRMISAGQGCSNETGGNPPQYQTCPPQPGTTNPAYTTVVNQLAKELWWSARVVDYFGTLEKAQNTLFADASNILPSLDANFNLGSAQGQSSFVDYLGLGAGILNYAADVFPEYAGLQTAVDVLGVLLGGSSLFQSPASAKLPQTYAGLLSTVTSLQQQAQVSASAAKHQVLGDYGLLATVGQLVSSQVWTVDPTGYGSVSRLQFTKAVYQAFLPTVWGLWEVSACYDSQGAFKELFCTPPSGTNVLPANATDFSALLLSSNSGCQESCGRPGQPCIIHCSWQAPAQATLNALFTPVSATCTYVPGSTFAWTYPANNAASGCTLGIDDSIFTNTNGWQLPVTTLNVQSAFMVVDSASRATNVGATDGSGRLHLAGSIVISRDFPDLRSLVVDVGALLAEAASDVELAGGRNGEGATSVRLFATSARGTRDRVRLQTPRGATPRVVVELHARRDLDRLEIALDVDDAVITVPRNCVGDVPSTRLAVQLALRTRGVAAAPLRVEQSADWACERDGAGRIVGLRASERQATRRTTTP